MLVAPWSCLCKIYGGAPEVPAQNIQSSEKLRSPASGFQTNPGKIPQSFEQGRTKWRNCRLAAKTPNYQLGWAILAECRQFDILKRNFLFMYIIKLLTTLPVTRAHYNINAQSTVPPLRSSLPLRKG